MDCSYETHRVLIGQSQTFQSSPKHFTHIANLNQGHSQIKLRLYIKQQTTNIKMNVITFQYIIL